MDIDWSNAPEWAVAHGLHETGFGIKEFWLGETQHQNLEHAKSFPYGGGDPSCGSFHNSRRESFSYVTKRPAAWNGEGTPPRGTKCEVQPWTEHEAPWIEVEFIASWLAPNGQTYSWVHTGYGWLEPEMFRFRPVRTPEQIAAEAREKAIAEMKKVFDSCSDKLMPTSNKYLETLFGAIYDAGWKQDSP